MFKNFTDSDRRIILESLTAIVEGPFLPDWEFSILMGLERSDVAKIISNWENIDFADMNVQLAINNSINNLLGYPHRASEEEWFEYLAISRDELREFFRKIKEGDGKNYFGNMM